MGAASDFVRCRDRTHLGCLGTDCWYTTMITAPADRGKKPARSDFREDAAVTIRGVRDSLAQVVSRIPEFSYRRPNDLAVALDLDPKLAWRIGRCLEEPDLFAAAQLLPGPAGIKTFLRAAARRHVPSDLVDSLRVQADRFSEMVRLHAGNRKNFNMLVTGVTESQRVRFDAEHRRKAFEGNSYIWGVHARTIFRANIVQPSADGEHWDLVTVRGFIDFRRMRPQVAWRLTRPSSVNDSHIRQPVEVFEPIDPVACQANGGVPLLPQFCTQPLPRFRPVIGPTGGTEFEFVAESIGKSSQLSCVTGELIRRLEPRYRHDQYETFSTMFPIRMPAEVLVFDLVVRRDLFPDRQGFSAGLYGDLFGGGPGLRYEDADRIPMADTLQFLGAGVEVARTPDIPQYVDMLNHSLAQAGWNLGEFDVYRLRMQYPPIPATAEISRPLPARLMQ